MSALLRSNSLTLMAMFFLILAETPAMLAQTLFILPCHYPHWHTAATPLQTPLTLSPILRTPRLLARLQVLSSNSRCMVFRKEPSAVILRPHRLLVSPTLASWSLIMSNWCKLESQLPRRHRKDSSGRLTLPPRFLPLTTGIIFAMALTMPP